VTVARNTTGAQGGGIENLGQLHTLDVTIAENSAPPGKGGGIFLAGSMFTAATLVAKNTGGDCMKLGAVTSSGANLAGDGSCGFANATDRTGDPGFDTSAVGPPLLYPLLATSHAVDTGIVCQPNDIRGVSRPQDGNGDGVASCDTGSYERAAGAQLSMSIRDRNRREGNHGRPKLRFKVRLSARAQQDVTVQATTEDGTARAGSDYKAKTETLVFERGHRTATFTVRLIADRQREPDETFKVKLSSPNGAVIADAEAIGTIVNDD
jgi:hypothetical protein